MIGTSGSLPIQEIQDNRSPRNVLTGENIVCFAKDWDDDPTSNTHVMRLLSRDNRVLWLNSIGMRKPSFTSGVDAARIVRRLKSGLRGARQVAANIWVLNPLVVPLAHGPAALSLNRLILRLTLARARRAQAPGPRQRQPQYQAVERQGGRAVSAEPPGFRTPDVGGHLTHAPRNPDFSRRTILAASTPAHEARLAHPIEFSQSTRLLRERSRMTWVLLVGSSSQSFRTHNVFAGKHIPTASVVLYLFNRRRSGCKPITTLLEGTLVGGTGGHSPGRWWVPRSCGPDVPYAAGFRQVFFAPYSANALSPFPLFHGEHVHPASGEPQDSLGQPFRISG